MKKTWVMRNLQGRRWMGDQRREHLLDVVVNNDHKMLEEMLSKSTKIQSKELTIAMIRVMLMKSDTYVMCINILLKYGANPDECDGMGTPYVVIATEAGCVGLLSSLLEAGCDVNGVKQDGATALHKAVMTGHHKIAKLLIQYGANLQLTDNLGRTPLLIACSLNHNTLVEEMFQQKTTLSDFTDLCNVPDNAGTFPLFYAISHNNTAIISMLISNGCELKVAHSCHISAIMVAAHYGCLDSMTLLHSNGAGVNDQNKAGETAILIAAKKQHILEFQYLLNGGADVRLVDNNQNATTLYMTPYPHILQELLSSGVPINLQGDNGHTPLSKAVEECQTKSVLILLQNGADPDPAFQYRPDRKKPLEISLRKGFLDISKVLFTICIELGCDMTWLEDFLSLPRITRRLDENYQDDNKRDTIQWIMEEMSKVENQFPHLLTLCRWNIREIIGDNALCNKIEKLPIPRSLKDFLKFKELKTLISTE